MHIPPDTCLLVADYGVGDHYLVAAFAEAIHRRYGVRTWMAGRADMPFICGLFPQVERYLHWPAELPREKLIEKAIKGGVMFDAHFPNLELMRAVGYRDFHFLDAYRCRFGLSADTRLTKARMPRPEELSEVQRLLEEAGVRPGHFVFLCPDTRSTPTDGITPEFWRTLAEGLHAKGLTPVFNARPDVTVMEPAIGLSVPLHMLRPLAMLSAGVCTARSGLSELFCDLPLPQSVVYADVKYWAGPLQKGTSFHSYGLELPPLERIVTPGSATRSAMEIAGHFPGPRALAAIQATTAVECAPIGS